MFDGVDIDGDVNEAVDIEMDNHDNMDDAIEVSWRLNKMNEKKMNKNLFFILYHTNI